MSPFDKAKFDALTEGLETAVIRSTDLERTNRIDAEFFQKRFLATEARMALVDSENVAKLTAVSDGNHFTITDAFRDEGIPYYRGQDVAGNFFIESSTPNFITQEAFDRPYMRRSHLRQGDVLLSIVGTIGELSLVSSPKSATCSCKLAILRPRKIKPEYLAVFLQSRFGRNQIERLTRGAVQRGLILEDLDQLLVGRFSTEFENAISAAVHSAKAVFKRSEISQSEAETILLSALGLSDWTPPDPLTYTRSARDVLATGRWDAQFYRPAYDVLRENLAKMFELKLLGRVGNVLKGRTVPYVQDGAVSIIRSGDLNDIEREDRFLRASTDEPIFYLERGDILGCGLN